MSIKKILKKVILKIIIMMIKIIIKKIKKLKIIRCSDNSKRKMITIIKGSHQIRQIRSCDLPMRELKGRCLFEWLYLGVVSTTWLPSYHRISARFCFRSPGL